MNTAVTDPGPALKGEPWRLGDLHNGIRPMPDLQPGGRHGRSARLAAALRQAVTDRVYRQGEQFPGSSILKRHYGVSQDTAEAALRILTAEGLLRAVHGRGHYVRGIPS